MKDFLELRIREVIPETNDARTYVLESLDGTIPIYQAGQFLTFLIKRGQKEWRRSYSLCSAPGVDPYLAVTIKRVANGEISRWLLDTLRVGDVIQSLYPAGRFTLESPPSQPRDLFLIGAGSGITPLFSILKRALVDEPQSPITLISSDKHPESAIFTRQLRILAEQYASRFNYLPLYSDPPEEVPYLRARLKNSLLEELVKKYLKHSPEQARFYICGPSDYMRMVQITLVFMSFPRDHIRRENFVVEPLAPMANDFLRDHSPRRIALTYREKSVSMQVPANRNILQAALDAGIVLPYSFRAGRCSTCIARCVRGKVRMTTNEVLTDREVTEGWILTCVAYAETEVVVEVPFIKQ
jgi:ring-1,2-phenylacetyl-CoA epoxidase subunit PaaE